MMMSGLKVDVVKLLQLWGLQEQGKDHFAPFDWWAVNP